MSQVKSKRIAPSAVNTPVTVHVKASKALSKEDTERFLSKFIENEETRSNQNLLNNSGNVNVTGASVSQLKRIQRDLRGLPPLESSTAPTSTTSTSTIKSKSAPKTHMKFDDEPVQTEDVTKEEESTSIPQIDEDVEMKDKSEQKLDKEERKRLKKEKRKAEKRAKLEKSE